MANASRLCIFAMQGNINKLNEMYNSKISLDSCDYDDRTALHVASAFG